MGQPLPTAPILPAVPPITPPVAPRRRRRRRLPHSDPEPQLPQAQFQAQLLQPESHCQPLVLPEPPKRRRWTPKQLLETPTCGWLPPNLWALWNRCRLLPHIEAPPVPPELPSEVEVLREALEPSLPPLPSSEVSLEVSEEELRPRLLIPEERRPLPPLPPPPLPELPERPEPELPPSVPPNMAALRRLVAAAARQPGGGELAAILPPTASRLLMGRLFYLCLELCGAGWLRLEQTQPFGPIRVGPGPRGAPPDMGQEEEERVAPEPSY
ncbi:meiotic recombination protein REC8 homolog [Pezoporus flaviventris]|uniref:meiotic recombination protein REC8 homolog n=1 Tax=Pezoporus flaviventris TaxID=889875 RepID=UPI002AB17BEE|nr:meiotic recombination protein REC8 homolog [Pezoporus flaviventris]